jgi:hypothetical protein
MKNTTKTFIYIILGLIIFIGLTLMIIYGSSSIKTEKKIVKCYDKHSNEIIGLKCEEIKNAFGYMVYVGGFLVGVGLGLLLLLLGSLLIPYYKFDTKL